MLREKSSTFQSTGRKRITSLIQNQAHTNWYVCPCLSVRRACVFLYQFPLRTQVESQNRNMYGSKVNAPVPKPMKPTKFPVASVLCCELCIHATQSKHFYTMSSSSTSWVLFFLSILLATFVEFVSLLFVCVSSSLLPTVHSRRVLQCIFAGNWKSCVRMFVYRHNSERN